MERVTSGTRRRGDTRGEIQRAALRRFNVQGYDKTSLREIAEDLGVTKAAVYYHFPTKEDILESLVLDVARSMDDLIAWAAAEPTTRERRLELLRRLGEATQGGLGELMRCVQQNELAMAAHTETVSIVRRYKRELWRVATPPDAGVEDLVRARMAIMTVLFADQGDELGGTEQERLDASLRVAAEIMP